MTDNSFLWGAATSSHQVEGHNKHNDWWAWEAKGNIEGGVRSGAATDHRRHFRDDIRLAQEMGLNSYRFSFEWSRIEPEEGRWDQAAFDWYGELLSECERHGLLPMATLHHFTLPDWLAQKGGFAFENSPQFFARYVAQIVKRFGARIPLWCTVNEPMVLVVGSYLGRFMPPADYNPEKASRSCYHLLKAHILAYDLIKGGASGRQGPFRERPLEVGFAHNMIHVLPDRKFHPLERTVAHVLSGLYNDAWLKAVNGERQRFGLPFVMPFAPQLELARGRRSFDFIGLNYYTKAYVSWRPRAHVKERAKELPLGFSFARRKDQTSDLGWAVHPAGLKRILRDLAKYKAPIYITENGIADAGDLCRQNYILSHLKEVAKALQNGVDVRGYYHWSLLDNFEWIKGFWPRFGLIEVDYETFARTPRESSYFYRDVIRAHKEVARKQPDQDVLATFR